MKETQFLVSQKLSNPDNPGHLDLQRRTMTEYVSDSGADEESSRHPEGVEPLGCKLASRDGGSADIRPAGEIT